MGDELSLLPDTKPQDVEDVVWGLQTAAALWGRGERVEALVWIRRAAEAASDGGDAPRAVELAKRAAELEQLLAAPGSARAVPPPPALVSFPTEAPPAFSARPPASIAPPKPPPPKKLEIEDPETLDPDAAADLLADEDTTEAGRPEVEAPSPVSQVPRTISRSTSAFAALKPGAGVSGPTSTPRPVSAPHPLASTQVSAVPSFPAPVSVGRPPLASAPSLSAPAPPASAAPVEIRVATHLEQAAHSQQVHGSEQTMRDSDPVDPQTQSPAPSSIAGVPDVGAMMLTPTASKGKRGRQPILDPWSDELPPSEPAPRTQAHRFEVSNDDTDVLTSAPPLDTTLKKKPPPPPKRSATLSGTMLAVTPESIDAARAPSSPNHPGEASKPPPLTRKPTLVPRAASVGETRSERKSIPPGALAAPPVPSERKSIPPPAYVTPPLSTLSITGSSPAAEPKSVPPPPTQAIKQPSSLSASGSPPLVEQQSASPPAAEPPAPASMGVPATTKSLPPPRPEPAAAEAKSDPPPPTMPAQRVPPPAPATLPGQGPPSGMEDEPTREEPPAVVVPVLFGDPSSPPAASMRADRAPRSSDVDEPTPPLGVPAPPRVKSEPPPRVKSEPPPRVKSEPPPRVKSEPPPRVGPSSIPPAERTLGALRLDKVDVFADVPADAQRRLCQRAQLTTLDIDDEVSGFGAALVLSGAGAVCATIADLPAHVLGPAALASTMTSLTDPGAIRVVATALTEIATWDRADLEDILGACPWVLDEIVRAGDRMASLAGATMGALGDLDESSRLAALQLLTTRALAPNEVLIPVGGDLLGLTIVGAGSVLLAREEGPCDYSAGDIVLAESLMEGGVTKAAVKAGPDGALVLVASRRTTMELFSTMPTLLELVR